MLLGAIIPKVNAPYSSVDCLDFFYFFFKKKIFFTNQQKIFTEKEKNRHK